MNSGPVIVVVGSLNADFVLNTPRFPAPGETVTGSSFKIHAGGKGANQAYAAARLGAQVRMVGQVGNDAHSRWLKDNLSAVGVDVSGVTSDGGESSGVAVISVDASGQNQIVIVPGANGTFGPERLERSREVIESAHLVLLQLEIPVETVELAARMAKRAGATVILDPAPARKLSPGLLGRVDYLTPNETELAQINGGNNNSRGDTKLDRARVLRDAQRMRESGVGKVIVKMGEAGALLVSENKPHFWPAHRVKAVDTTGAGDAFNAAFAAALARGKNDIEAGSFAAAAAACSVTRTGAQDSMPSFDDVALLLRGGT